MKHFEKEQHLQHLSLFGLSSGSGIPLILIMSRADKKFDLTVLLNELVDLSDFLR